ncbi:anthranilate synthase component I family protein [Candidatus Peregrinibacteria bacterium]|nr:anthranilate synthase component I family protein [Candidatus Peregrinibacteria bacterium]
MKITESDISREGFAVLHGKWGGRQGCIVGLNGKSEMRNPKCEIGYLAYPNPTLKNDTPSSRFYKYDTILRRRDAVIAHDGVNMVYKTTGKLEQSVTKTEYIKKINQIKELLAAGEIYQINYAIRFRKKFDGSPYAFFLKLIEANPGDFSAYINCGKFQIISSSPERLFKVEGDKIITQPIKGTVSKAGGKKSLNKLLNSEKERAELDMITDLERNDIGKICKYGTLKLAKEREIMELKNIWHTYSQVEGRLETGIKLNEITNAMFPGGSITGCPKKRAMEYIEELEGLPRNIFTGSIGFISNVRGAECRVYRTSNIAPRTTIDMNICIRTALVHNGIIEYWAGGGIVADSDPESEYNECLLKAERFINIL